MERDVEKVGDGRTREEEIIEQVTCKACQAQAETLFVLLVIDIILTVA
jgi:hypothetical protein